MCLEMLWRPVNDSLSRPSRRAFYNYVSIKLDGGITKRTVSIVPKTLDKSHTVRSIWAASSCRIMTNKLKGSRIAPSSMAL
jgi:hypothetical protein